MDSTSKLFDGISSISSDSEDSFLQWKNRNTNKMLFPPRRLGMKLFSRNSPSVPRITKSEIMACINMTPNLNKNMPTNIGFPLTLNNDNACLPIPSTHTARNSIVAQNSSKPKTSNSIKSMLMYLDNLSVAKNQNKSQVKRKRDSGSGGMNSNNKQKLNTLLSSTFKTTETTYIKKNTGIGIQANFKLQQHDNKSCFSRETQTSDSFVKEQNRLPPKKIIKGKKCIGTQSDNNANIYTEAAMDDFLLKFDKDVIPQFASVNTISSESENLSTNSIANKIPVKNASSKSNKGNKSNSRTNDKNVTSNYNLRSLKTKSKLNSIDIEGTNDNPEVFNVTPRNAKNEKLRIGTSFNNSFHSNRHIDTVTTNTENHKLKNKSKKVAKKQLTNKGKEKETNNVQEKQEMMVAEKQNTRKRGKTIESKISSNTSNFEDIEYPKTKKRAKTSVNGNTKSTRKGSNRRRSTTKVVVNPKKPVNLRNYTMNRKSGFVEVHQDNSNDDNENQSGRTRRNRKPPKAFIQATFLSPRVLRSRTVKIDTASTPTTATAKNSKAKTTFSSSSSTNNQASTSAKKAKEDTIVNSKEQVFKKPTLRPRNKKTNKQSNVGNEKNTIQNSTACSNNEIIDSGINTMSTTSRDVINDTKMSTPIVSCQKRSDTRQNEILNAKLTQCNDITCNNNLENEMQPASTSNNISNSTVNNYAVTEPEIIPRVIESMSIENEDTDTNIRVELRKSNSFQQIPEENCENQSPPDLAVDFYNVQSTDNSINATENILYRNVSVNRNSNIHTVINNEVESLKWCSHSPYLDMESSNKNVTIKYCLKDTKTHFAMTSCGYLIFAPGEKQVQTSMRHSIIFKVERGQGAVYIQLQKEIIQVGCCFHIPLGSTYGITNLSQTEQLVLFFHKNSML